MRVFIVFVCLAVLSACSAISLSSLWSLSSVELRDIDSVEARIGLAFSEPFPLTDAGLEIGITTPDGQTDSVAFDFERVTDEAELAAVGFPPDFTSVVLFKIPSEHVDAVRRVQDTIQRARDTGNGDNELNISINTNLADDLKGPDCEALVSRLRIYSTIRVNRSKGYIPLTKRSLISRLISDSKSGFCTE